MTLRSNVLLAATALGAVLLGAPPLIADSQPATQPGNNCFLTTNWQGWKSPSPTVIYLRIGLNEVYRIDLAAASYQLQQPEMHLVSRVRGSPWICGPLDLDLSLSDDHGIYREPLFVKSLTKLTPDEVKAIPPKFVP